MRSGSKKANFQFTRESLLTILAFTSDSCGQCSYSDEADEVFKDIFSIKKYTKNALRAKTNSDAYFAVNAIGKENASTIFGSKIYIEAIRDLIDILIKMDDLKKKIKKRIKSGKKNNKTYSKQLKKLDSLYHKGIKRMRKELKLNTDDVKFKDKYSGIRRIIEGDDVYGSIYGSLYGLDDDDEDDEDDSPRARRSSVSDRVRANSGIDFDDDDELDVDDDDDDDDDEIAESISQLQEQQTNVMTALGEVMNMLNTMTVGSTPGTFNNVPLEIKGGVDSATFTKVMSAVTNSLQNLDKNQQALAERLDELSDDFEDDDDDADTVEMDDDDDALVDSIVSRIATSSSHAQRSSARVATPAEKEATSTEVAHNIQPSPEVVSGEVVESSEKSIDTLIDEYNNTFPETEPMPDPDPLHRGDKYADIENAASLSSRPASKRSHAVKKQ